jgi:steroid delta-isomerase-like uncharacterized protein
MTRNQIEALFARREEALRRRDVAAVTALYAADAVVDSPTAGRPVNGRDEIESVTRAWFSAFPDVTFTTTRLIIDGDYAVWVAEVHGTDVGGFLGLAPTSKPFTVPMVVLCTLNDDGIVHEKRIYDFTGMLVQIGVLKARPV